MILVALCMLNMHVLAVFTFPEVTFLEFLIQKLSSLLFRVTLAVRRPGVMVSHQIYNEVALF